MYYSLSYGKSLPIRGALLYCTPRKVHVAVTTHLWRWWYSKKCSLIHLSMTCRVPVSSSHHNLRNKPLCVLVFWKEIHPPQLTSSSRQYASSPSGARVPAVWFTVQQNLQDKNLPVMQGSTTGPSAEEPVQAAHWHINKLEEQPAVL